MEAYCMMNQKRKGRELSDVDAGALKSLVTNI